MISTTVNKLMIDFGIQFPTTPLGLKPIGAVSYTHLSFIVFKLLDVEGFSK